MHLAAHAKVHQLVLEPAQALENIEMTVAALELRAGHATPIIFGSSREVYGDIHRHVTDEGMADFVVAESPYSASKIAGEAFLYSYARCYGLPVLVFRFSNVYGRYDNDLDRMERVIPLFLRQIVAGEPITVFGAEQDARLHLRRRLRRRGVARASTHWSTARSSTRRSTSPTARAARSTTSSPCSSWPSAGRRR